MLDGDVEFEGIAPDFIHILNMVNKEVCLFVFSRRRFFCRTASELKYAGQEIGLKNARCSG